MFDKNLIRYQYLYLKTRESLFLIRKPGFLQYAFHGGNCTKLYSIRILISQGTFSFKQSISIKIKLQQIKKTKIIKDSPVSINLSQIWKYIAKYSNNHIQMNFYHINTVPTYYSKVNLQVKTDNTYLKGL